MGNVEILVTFTRAVLVKYGQQQLDCSRSQRMVGEAVVTARRAALLRSFAIRRAEK